MTRWALIALGGAIGALLRYSVSSGAHRAVDTTFPIGTLTVNGLGCFAIGLAWVLLEASAASAELRALVLIGGLGAFTTFSTFGFETLQLVRDGAWRLAMANVLANNLIGFALVVAGVGLGRVLTRT